MTGEYPEGGDLCQSVVLRFGDFGRMPKPTRKMRVLPIPVAAFTLR